MAFKKSELEVLKIKKSLESGGEKRYSFRVMANRLPENLKHFDQFGITNSITDPIQVRNSRIPAFNASSQDFSGGRFRLSKRPVSREPHENSNAIKDLILCGGTCHGLVSLDSLKKLPQFGRKVRGSAEREGGERRSRITSSRTLPTHSSLPPIRQGRNVGSKPPLSQRPSTVDTRPGVKASQTRRRGPPLERWQASEPPTLCNCAGIEDWAVWKKKQPLDELANGKKYSSHPKATCSEIEDKEQFLETALQNYLHKEAPKPIPDGQPSISTVERKSVPAARQKKEIKVESKMAKGIGKPDELQHIPISRCVSLQDLPDVETSEEAYRNPGLLLPKSGSFAGSGDRTPKHSSRPVTRTNVELSGVSQTRNGEAKESNETKETVKYRFSFAVSSQPRPRPLRSMTHIGIDHPIHSASFSNKEPLPRLSYTRKHDTSGRSQSFVAPGNHVLDTHIDGTGYDTDEAENKLVPLPNEQAVDFAQRLSQRLSLLEIKKKDSSKTERLHRALQFQEKRIKQGHGARSLNSDRNNNSFKVLKESDIECVSEAPEIASKLTGLLTNGSFDASGPRRTPKPSIQVNNVVVTVDRSLRRTKAEEIAATAKKLFELDCTLSKNLSDSRTSNRRRAEQKQVSGQSTSEASQITSRQLFSRTTVSDLSSALDNTAKKRRHERSEEVQRSQSLRVIERNGVQLPRVLKRSKTFVRAREMETSPTRANGILFNPKGHSSLKSPDQIQGGDIKFHQEGDGVAAGGQETSEESSRVESYRSHSLRTTHEVDTAHARAEILKCAQTPASKMQWEVVKPADNSGTITDEHSEETIQLLGKQRKEASSASSHRGTFSWKQTTITPSLEISRHAPLVDEHLPSIH